MSDSETDSTDLFEITDDAGFPFVGYTWDDEELYCKACGANNKLSHHGYCPQFGHWPSKNQIENDQAHGESRDASC